MTAPVEASADRQEDEPAQGRGAHRRGLVATVKRPEGGLTIALVAVVVMFTIINPVFSSVDNAQNILRSVPYIALIAIGMTVLMISGNFDLSVGSVAALGAVVVAKLAEIGVPLLVALVAGLLIGAAVGLVNAWLALWRGVPVLVVTLGMLYIARGLALVITNGQPINPIPDALVSFGRGQWFGLTWPVYIVAVVAVVAQIVLSRTPTGRRLYACGGNDYAAHLAGVRVRRLRTGAFVATSVLSAAAGIMLMARLQIGQPSIGQGYELLALGGAVVGGVSLFGGSGSVVGALLGVVFVQVIGTGVVLAKIDPSLQPVLIGIALLGAVGLDALARRRA